MEINYSTKEQSNDAQRNYVLNLSAGERFEAWLTLMYRSKQLIGRREPETGNFLVRIKPR